MQSLPETPATNEPESTPVSKSNAAWILAATVSTLLALPYGDDRSVDFAHRMWKLHDQNLDGVAMAVGKYKDVHG